MMRKKHVVIAFFVTFLLYSVIYVAQAFVMGGIRAPLIIFQEKWFFIIPLVVGFFIQVYLYQQIRHRVRGARSMMVVSGGTSGTAMVACCLHNVAFLLPIVGFSGFAGLLSVYQNYIFGFSILAVVAGVVYLARKLQRIPTCCDVVYSSD